MKTHHAVSVALAACHLALVVCGALDFPADGADGLVGEGLRWYGGLSGADCRYGLFAPEVSSQRRITVTLTDDSSRTWTATPDRGLNREVQLRLDNILTTAAFFERKDSITAAWAAQQFARYPDATRVRISLEWYCLPTMAEYRAGERPQWRLSWRTTFTRTPEH